MGVAELSAGADRPGSRVLAGLPLSWLELSRADLLHNLAGVRRIVGSARVVAVLKANAYGAGAAGMASVLAGDGVDAFAVANVAEALELRTHGVAGMVLVLTYFTRGEVDAIARHDLTATVFTHEAAQWLHEGARRTGMPISVWIKVDTGLNRLGVPYPQAAAFIDQMAQYPALRISGVYSTLTENPERDLVQVQRLRSVRDQVPGLRALPFSIASSHGIVALRDSLLDAVRPGIMLLGLEPSDRARMDMQLVEQADLRPIMTWKARVGYVKRVPQGEQVGYGLRPPLAHDTVVATVTTGWADGYPPSMTGDVLFGGRRCPVLAVSANSTLVDVSAAPAVSLGDEVVLLGRQGDAAVTAYEVAQAAGSVYRLLTAIPREVPRVWT